MPSLIYTSFFNDLLRANIDFDVDTIRVMLVTSGYTEDKDAHAKRSSITNEISGTGYTAGGATVTCTVAAVDTANDDQELTLGGATWPTSTITARKAVYYKSRGGAATADELIAIIDFGADVSTTAGTFTLNSSTIRIQN